MACRDPCTKEPLSFKVTDGGCDEVSVPQGNTHNESSKLISWVLESVRMSCHAQVAHLISIGRHASRSSGNHMLAPMQAAFLGNIWSMNWTSIISKRIIYKKSIKLGHARAPERVGGLMPSQVKHLRPIQTLGRAAWPRHCTNP